MQGLDPDLRALQDVRDCMRLAKQACEKVAHFSQAQVDRLCQAMSEASAGAAYDLARIAVEETGIGRVHYKVLKNLFAAEGIWASIRSEKSVGIISRDERAGVLEVATPAGIIAAIIPTTNPTSTAIGKALIAIKGRNAIVISPHPRSRRCIFETCQVLRRAIERAGGPGDLIQCLQNPTVESTAALMKHRDTAIILSTGGSGLVRAAYSSGKPAYGVGPGNVPCYVDRSADVALAAATIIASQSFDNGTLCCSEQALIVDAPIESALIGEMRKRGAHLCNEDEIKKLGAIANKNGLMNPEIVGKDPAWVAERAGFSVPAHTSLLLAPQGGVGAPWPLSIEILCPILSVHRVEGWEQGCKVSMEVLHLDGLGHTCGVWAKDERVLEAWFLEKPAGRIIVNGPTSEGAVGYSTALVPSMSLGCGPQAGNITSDNITARHLLNIKRVAYPRSDWPDIYRRDHARAAALTGETAPRGSGLPGDPALAIGSRREPSRPAISAPNLAPVPVASIGAPPSAPARAPRSFSEPLAPRSSNPGHSNPGHSTSDLERPRAPSNPAQGPSWQSSSSLAATATLAAPARTTTHVGESLSPDEIRELMKHAGQGCPLGPCLGCPHLEVKTGACTA